MRSAAEVVLGVIAAVGSVVTWLAARTTVEVAPVVDGQPSTTSLDYHPPLLVLSLLLATVAGVLIVLAVSHLRRAGRPG